MLEIGPNGSDPNSIHLKRARDKFGHYDPVVPSAGARAPCSAARRGVAWRGEKTLYPVAELERWLAQNSEAPIAAQIT